MKKSFSTKAVALVLAGGLLVGATVGGTLAWLMDTTSAVTNTFTVGNIEITLDEARVDVDGNFLDSGKQIVGNITMAERVTNNQYQTIPGKTYPKDPTLTVKKGNEKCYVFVKVEEINNPYDYYTYNFNLADSGWKQLGTTTSADNVDTSIWYKIVDETSVDADADTVFKLLKDNKIQVKDTVTKENMTSASAAKLQWTAYAVQYWNDDKEFTPEQAWDIAQDGTLTTP